MTNQHEDSTERFTSLHFKSYHFEGLEIVEEHYFEAKQELKKGKRLGKLIDKGFYLIEKEGYTFDYVFNDYIRQEVGRELKD